MIRVMKRIIVEMIEIQKKKVKNSRIEIKIEKIKK